jgi:predicted O-linked N-acetylglucosamine transferase (SPINDLY family)
VTREFSAVFAFGGVILNHDPKQFEVICYSDMKHEGKISAHFHKRADVWRLTKELSDDQMAELIRRDRIDILVDVNGHMGRHRLLVFARKPAPIQVTAWGEPTGTGLNVMDYLLADPVLVPQSERPLLCETVVDLPNFLGYWTPEPLPQPGPLPALAHGHITFGSFSRLAKITHPVISSWASILNKLPTAKLVLKDRELIDADNRTYLERAFFAQGVSAERLVILGNTDRTSHFVAYQMIDIALDPFPHGGGLTTLDAIWMGVPVLTWPGQTISSRLAAASLAKLGLTDFIASSAANYVDLAISKAKNLEALSQLRFNLRDRVASSEFGDDSRYGQAVEVAYRQMWRRWCAGQTPTLDRSVSASRGHP